MYHLSPSRTSIAFLGSDPDVAAENPSSGGCPGTKQVPLAWAFRSPEVLPALASRWASPEGTGAPRPCGPGKPVIIIYE